MAEWYYKEFGTPEGNISVGYHIFMLILGVITIVFYSAGLWIGILIMLLVVIRLIGGNRNFVHLFFEFLLGMFISLSTGLFWGEVIFGGILLGWNGIVLAKHWGVF